MIYFITVGYSFTVDILSHLNDEFTQNFEINRKNAMAFVLCSGKNGNKNESSLPLALVEKSVHVVPPSNPPGKPST